MKYKFGSSFDSKSFSQMIQLKQNIEKGVICSVATMNPLKVKRNFEYMTGSELNLNHIDGNVYKATIS